MPGIIYLILDQATLTGWDDSHFTGKEPEAKINWVVCQSWEVVELDLNSHIIDVEAQAGPDILPGPRSAKPGSRGPQNAHTSQQLHGNCPTRLRKQLPPAKQHTDMTSFTPSVSECGLRGWRVIDSTSWGGKGGTERDSGLP